MNNLQYKQGWLDAVEAITRRFVRVREPLLEPKNQTEQEAFIAFTLVINVIAEYKDFAAKAGEKI